MLIGILRSLNWRVAIFAGLIAIGGLACGIGLGWRADI